MFRGINAVTFDEKFRIKLPKRYRELISVYKASEAECSMVATIDTESPCLLLYPLKEWELIEEKLQALPSFNPAARRIQRLLIGHASDLKLDMNGRILLPEILRDYAEMKENEKISVVGQGRKIELWSSEKWNEYCKRWLSELTKPNDLPDDLQSLAL